MNVKKAFGSDIYRLVIEAFLPIEPFDMLSTFIETELIPREQNKQASLVQHVRSEQTDLTEDQATDRLDPEYTFYTSRLPQLLRSTYVIGLHSALEVSLNGLCDVAAHNLTTNVTYRDLSDRKGKVQRAVLFLQKVAEVPVPTDTPEWKEIQVLSMVRNVFVHEWGYFNKRNETLTSYVQQNPDRMSIASDTRLIVEGPYLPWITVNVRTFFRSLLGAGVRA
jgi:hypothetical protein